MEIYKSKAFTLIELLVVVAIIGILAAVGVVAYNGYTNSAKLNSLKSNMKNFEKFIKAEMIRCEIQSTITLQSKENTPSQKENISCTKGSASFTTAFVNHLNNNGFKNPYNSNQPAFVTLGRPYDIGQIYVNTGGNDPNAITAWGLNGRIDQDTSKNLTQVIDDPRN